MLYGHLSLLLHRRLGRFSCQISLGCIRRACLRTYFCEYFSFMIRSWRMSGCPWNFFYQFSGTGVGEDKLEWIGKVVSLY